MDDKQILMDITKKIFEMDKYFEEMDDLIDHIDQRLEWMRGRFEKLDPTLVSSQEMIKIQLFQNCGDLITIKEDLKNIRDRFPEIERELDLLLGKIH